MDTFIPLPITFPVILFVAAIGAVIAAFIGRRRLAIGLVIVAFAALAGAVLWTLLP